MELNHCTKDGLPMTKTAEVILGMPAIPIEAPKKSGRHTCLLIAAGILIFLAGAGVGLFFKPYLFPDAGAAYDQNTLYDIPGGAGRTGSYGHDGYHYDAGSPSSPSYDHQGHNHHGDDHHGNQHGEQHETHTPSGHCHSTEDPVTCSAATTEAACTSTLNSAGSYCTWTSSEPENEQAGTPGNCGPNGDCLLTHAQNQAQCESTLDAAGHTCTWVHGSGPSSPSTYGSCGPDTVVCGPITSQASCEATTSPGGGVCVWTHPAA